MPIDMRTHGPCRGHAPYRASGFGSLFCRARQVANWSLRDVAWYLGLSVSLLSDIERGYAQPLDRTVITRLAAEWQIDPTPLLGALQRQDDDSFAQTDSEEETPDAP